MPPRGTACTEEAGAGCPRGDEHRVRGRPRLGLGVAAHIERSLSRRYKFLYSSGHMRPLFLHFSADGVHWGDPVGKSVPWSDRTTFFYNPFRKVWVCSLRDHSWTPADKKANRPGRLRKYWEHRDVVEGLRFRPEDPKLWAIADRLDARRIDLNVRPQLCGCGGIREPDGGPVHDLAGPVHGS